MLVFSCYVLAEMWKKLFVNQRKVLQCDNVLASTTAEKKLAEVLEEANVDSTARLATKSRGMKQLQSHRSFT